MGVDVGFYVMHGVNVPYDKELAHVMMDYEDEHTDKDVQNVRDAMGGKYIVLGDILSAMYGYDDGGFLRELDLDNLEDKAEVYRKKFKAAFPKWAHLVDVPFKIITFVHYS